jgi:hypothetical protein
VASLAAAHSPELGSFGGRYPPGFHRHSRLPTRAPRPPYKTPLTPSAATRRGTPLHLRPPCRCRQSPCAPAPPPAAPRRRRPAPRTSPPPEGACCVPPARSDAGEPALSGPLPLSSRSRKSPAPRFPPVNQLLLPLDSP